MTRILERFAILCKERRAATAIEYGLIVSLIVIAMIGALSGLASRTNEMWNYVSDVSASVQK